ncbi:hypothetical protein B4113_2952 [Geobacillus sp. B4113_201601]|nr:hypothetical protein B4113_2952 [Geobacillus sp. B4113_201601]
MNKLNKFARNINGTSESAAWCPLIQKFDTNYLKKVHMMKTKCDLI